jgi:hypothetical protein
VVGSPVVDVAKGSRPVGCGVGEGNGGKSSVGVAFALVFLLVAMVKVET